MEYGEEKRDKDLFREKRKLNQLKVILQVNKFALNWASLAKNGNVKKYTHRFTSCEIFWTMLEMSFFSSFQKSTTFMKNILV